MPGGKTMFAGLSTRAPKAASVEPAAILNLDDASYAHLDSLSGVRQISYSLSARADVRSQFPAPVAGGLSFEVVGAGYRQPVRSSLRGSFNVANILTAFAATVDGLGLAPEVAARGVASVASIAGRMEPVDLGQAFTALVDFAHTPNALRRALEAARAMTTAGAREPAAFAIQLNALGWRDPFGWLALGWRDFQRCPGIGLFYG